MTGRSQIWDGAQWINLSNNPGSKGDTGETGPPGDGGGVSVDAGNQAVLGSDSLVYVPDFADGVYLKLTGGTVTGAVLFADGSSSLPSVAMLNNPSMGMYRVGLNKLGFSTGGSARLELNALSGVPSIGSPVDGGPNAAAFGFINNTLGFGMYRVGEDQLGFTIGNALRLTLTTSVAIFNTAISLVNGGTVESVVAAGSGVGQIRNIHRAQVDPTSGDGNNGDTWYVY